VELVEKRSFAQSIWPIDASLVMAERFLLGPNRVWRYVNQTQEAFIRDHLGVSRGGSLDVVRSIASYLAHEIEAWLKQHGFEIKIETLERNEFSVASVLDVLLKWPQDCAEKSELHVDETRYTGVWIKRGAKFLYTSAQDTPKKPIVKLPTDNKSINVFLTMLDEPPLGEFGLVTYARYLSSVNKQCLDLYDTVGVLFPMIQLEEHSRLDWIRKMWTFDSAGFPALIKQAVQINRLRMNEDGVRAQSAVQIRIPTIGGSSRKPYIFNHPFLLWIEHDSSPEPLFSAWLNFDSWKNPHGLK
jgi:hypothetical protein